MSESDASKAIWPSYALRAWLGALLTQTHRAQTELESRINTTEKELARLRRQHERAGSVIQSLQGATGKVDARLRQILDTEVPPTGVNRGAPAAKESEDKNRQEHPEPEPAKHGYSEPSVAPEPASSGKETGSPSSVRGGGKPRS